MKSILNISNYKIRIHIEIFEIQKVYKPIKTITDIQRDIDEINTLLLIYTNL